MAGEFDKLNDSLDIDFEEATLQVEDNINKKNEIAEKVQAMILSSAEPNNQKYTLEDKEYIKFELQSLIENNKRVMMSLQAELKIGAPPRTYETYAVLSNSTVSIIKELMVLNKQLTNYQVIESQENTKKELTLKSIDARLKASKTVQNADSITNVQNNVMMLDYKEMSKILQEAKTKSLLNNVDATFDLRGN